MKSNLYKYSIEEFKPNDLIKSFSNIRKKVHEIDVSKRFNDLLYSSIKYKDKANILNKIKELDSQIENAGYDLVKCLNASKG